MGNHYVTNKEQERAVLVAVSPKKEPLQQVEEHLTELRFLAETLGMLTAKTFIQRLEHPDPHTFAGKGKLEEIIDYVQSQAIDAVIFDEDISPSQLRNLEKKLQVKIYDRSLLILDIFLKRAQTAQAKTQVALARYQYLLPRLTRLWTHLERQRGGTGTRGGAGEKEIETDRRIIRDQIGALKKKLEKIDKQGVTRRKSRANVVRVSLVGYTNAGKSTLMKLLSREEAYVKDELFATVDSTIRKIVIKDIPFLLSDTVGFIRKLPHQLIESFKSTLDEVCEADVLLHVVDLSHPAFEEHIQVVNDTLSQLHAREKPTIMVYNKVDQLTDGADVPLGIKGKGEQSNHPNHIFISATKRTRIDTLKNMIFEHVKSCHVKLYPHYLDFTQYPG